MICRCVHSFIMQELHIAIEVRAAVPQERQYQYQFSQKGCQTGDRFEGWSQWILKHGAPHAAIVGESPVIVRLLFQDSFGETPHPVAPWPTEERCPTSQRSDEQTQSRLPSPLVSVRPAPVSAQAWGALRSLQESDHWIRQDSRLGGRYLCPDTIPASVKL